MNLFVISGIPSGHSIPSSCPDVLLMVGGSIYPLDGVVLRGDMVVVADDLSRLFVTAEESFGSGGGTLGVYFGNVIGPSSK